MTRTLGWVLFGLIAAAGGALAAYLFLPRRVRASVTEGEPTVTYRAVDGGAPGAAL